MMRTAEKSGADQAYSITTACLRASSAQPHAGQQRCVSRHSVAPAIPGVPRSGGNHPDSGTAARFLADGPAWPTVHLLTTASASPVGPR